MGVGTNYFGGTALKYLGLICAVGSGVLGADALFINPDFGGIREVGKSINELGASVVIGSLGYVSYLIGDMLTKDIKPFLSLSEITLSRSKPSKIELKAKQVTNQSQS